MVLVAGGLGSGKTTLLRRLIDAADRRVAILMNEFGEVAIDSRIIEGRHIRMVELTGGCVCCSLVGEFEAAVGEILERARPDLIAVETTGVAEPDALILEVEDNLPRVRLDCVVLVADADVMVRFPHLGAVTRMQFESAHVVLLNKIDLVTPADAQTAEVRIAGVNPAARLMRTVRCDIDPGLIFGMGSAGTVRSRPHPGRPSGPTPTSFTFLSPDPLDREAFEAFVEGLPAQIFRAKGFLRLGTEGFLFNYVAGRWDLEPFETEGNELVFIGHGADGVRESVIDSLRSYSA
jgi:G3E family GTPase